MNCIIRVFLVCFVLHLVDKKVIRFFVPFLFGENWMKDDSMKTCALACFMAILLVVFDMLVFNSSRMVFSFSFFFLVDSMLPGEHYRIAIKTRFHFNAVNQWLIYCNILVTTKRKEEYFSLITWSLGMCVQRLYAHVSVSRKTPNLQKDEIW